MTAAPKIPPALDRMFESFQGFLYETAGIYFPEQRRDRLLTHVAARMEAVRQSDPGQYLAHLKASRGLGSEQWAFFNQVTVNETYFFREDQQFAVFRDKVLPALFAARDREHRDRVTILSAACSSGEEAYSLAILILEALPREASRVTILGVDLNSEVVDQAKKGLYGDYSVRNCTPEQLKRHFQKQGALYQISADVRRMVTFNVANLADAAAMGRLPRPDLILCRNALIYFDRASKARVLTNLGAILRPGGYLFLSQTETLFEVDHPFELVHFFRVCGYRPKA
ncbi:MAG: protein-glutamate O-methyltransferase CheR [Proteobacteria bacterium]|nr:protein-glutamate O-methyltransferase CheR [Pseudomonadota bacterium]